MIFGWLRNRRRRRLLSAPLPDGWRAALEAELPFYGQLTDAERSKFEGDVRLFLAERHWEGCGGFELTESVRRLVAGWACLLVLGRDIDEYERVETILVYPDSFQVPGEDVGDDGVVVEFEEERLGEAWFHGPVVLSWAEIEADRAAGDDGRNLILHEFSHQLDMADGWIDGTPRLDDRADFARWRTVLTAAYERLVDAARRRRSTLLDPYGAEDPAEFFAVATECFFELPLELSEEEPDLYRCLASYYHQDPARRLAGRGDRTR